MDLSKYSIDELVGLKNKINNMIYDYKDGYFYICNGRNWEDNSIFNVNTLQELCYEYGGDNGIVDVYSNNPNLSKLDNYGDVMFVTTKEDYDKWKEHRYITNMIPEIEKELDIWDNRENAPFRERPMFSPVYSRESLAEMKQKIADYDMSFVAPVRVNYVDDNQDNDSF